MSNRRKKNKTWCVFYTPEPAEHELIIEAPTLEAAVKKVTEVLGQEASNIHGGWEIKPENTDAARALFGMKL